VERSRRLVEAALTDGEAHYGINTGFGALAKRRIDARQLAELQLNLVRSHSAGVGEPLPEETVRATMLVLAASLCRGMSGVRRVVPATSVAMLNAGLTPVVPAVGSVGASGDLAPLAAIALVAVGEGRATLGGREMTGAEALRKGRIRPLTLSAKEGLALINGTHLMAGSAALLLADAERLLGAALAALAMSIDACRASHEFLDDRLYVARRHEGARDAAAQLRRLLRGGTIRRSHVKNDPRVQDPYSLRAGPTVHGAVAASVRDIGAHVASELGAVTDNPLVFAEARGLKGPAPVISGANFHGMPIALPLDYLAVALCHLAGISERRTYLMTAAQEPESHLRPFLAPRPGLQSGLMVAQYTAAACVNEMIGLATPASVANIPTCAGMEDYNSFGPRAAAKARRACDLASRVIAIELLCAAEGLETHRPLRSGAGVEKAYRIVREAAPPLSADRPLTGDIERIARRVRDGAFVL
jgi:histidine ammonia-lyase